MRELRDYSVESRASWRAAKLQEHADTESLEVYVKGAPADHLHGLLQGNNATWQQVHGLLRHYGLELEKGDKGGYTVRAIGKDLRVKASKVFRNDFAGRAAKHGLNVRFTEDRMNQWLKIDQKRYLVRGLSRER